MPASDDVLRSITPILRMFDPPATRRFYLEWLGFELCAEWLTQADGPRYWLLQRGPVCLHVSSHHGDGCPGSRVLIWVSDIHRLHAELTSRPYAFYRPAVETADWGALTMLLLDPAGNALMFAQRA